MSSLPVPSIQDVARLVRETDAETADALADYYLSAGASFNYGPASRMARHVFARELPLAAALHACETRGNPKGRRQNAEVVRLIWEAGDGRLVRCYPLSSRRFSIRNDLTIRVNPPFYFVENSVAKVFWLQPRRQFALSTIQLGLLASVIRMAFIVDDFEEAGLELLDVSVPGRSKARAIRIYDLTDLPLLSDADVQKALQRFARAYDEVRARGVTKPNRQPRPPEPRVPGLFG